MKPLTKHSKTDTSNTKTGLYTMFGIKRYGNTESGFAGDIGVKEV